MELKTKKVRTSVKMTQDLYDKLRIMAFQEKTTQGEVIAKALKPIVDEYFKKISPQVT